MLIVYVHTESDYSLSAVNQALCVQNVKLFTAGYCRLSCSLRDIYGTSVQRFPILFAQRAFPSSHFLEGQF